MTPMAGIGARALANSVARTFDSVRFDLRVLRLEHHADEPAVAVDEVPLVAESVRLPLQVRLDGERHREPDAVEHDVRGERPDGLVGDGRVLEAELVLRRGAQDELELPESRLLDPEVAHEINPRSGDAGQRLAGDGDIGRRAPEVSADLDVIGLAGGPIGGAPDCARAGAAGRPKSRQSTDIVATRVRMFSSRPGLDKGTNPLQERARQPAGKGLLRIAQPTRQSGAFRHPSC